MDIQYHLEGGAFVTVYKKSPGSNTYFAAEYSVQGNYFPESHR